MKKKFKKIKNIRHFELTILFYVANSAGTLRNSIIPAQKHTSTYSNIMFLDEILAQVSVHFSLIDTQMFK